MVTIKDISEVCGVSPATVSKALNGYGDVSKEKAEMIRETAKRMNYYPNAAAKQLKTSVSHNIGVLFVDETACGLTHEFFSEILNSAKTEAERLGYDITFICKNIAGREASYLEHARYRKCDGVLVASVDFMSQAVQELVYSEVPTVTIDYVYNDRSSVLSDNIEGEYALTKYLIEHGHRKIAFIHGENTSVTDKRMAGFYRACEEGNITVPDRFILESRYHDIERCRDAVRELMSQIDRPTAIIFPDDYSYIGGKQALDEMHIKIPEDVSVVGYDGIRLTRALSPMLTTYYQDTVEIGIRSVRKLIDIIENPKTSIAEQIKIQGRIQEGSTVKYI